MARDITVTFDDGSQHVYQGAPDDVTPAAIETRAQKDFGKKVTALDGGRRTASAPKAPEPQRPLESRIPSNTNPDGSPHYPAPVAPPPPPEQAAEKPGLMAFLTGAPRQGMPQAPGMGALGAIGRSMVAPVETAAALGTGATTGMLGGLLNVGNTVAQVVTDAIRGKNADEIRATRPGIEEAFTQGMQAGTYSPRTPEAQAQTEAIGGALQEHGPALMGLGPELAALGKGVGAAARSPLAGQVASLPGRVAEAVVPTISRERATNVAAGMEQGVTPAPHQLAGNKFVKMAGETAESVPGSFGKMRREERQAAFTQALVKHINPEAEGAVKLTPEVLGEAMDRSGGKIGEITGKTAIPIEDVQGSFDSFRRRLGRTTEDQQRVAGGYVDEFERIAAENGGQIPGENFKNLNSELGADIRANAGNPMGKLLSDLQDRVMDAFRDKLSAEDRAVYDTSRAEYAKAKTILPLVAKSVEGDISPGALMNAINATKSGKNAMALGYAGELGELARAGKYLTEAKSSGTAERNLVHQLILDPIKGAAKVATIYPAATAYNLAGPAITRAMVRKGLKGAPEAPRAGEVPPTEPAPPGGGGPAPETPPAAPDPRLAEIAKLREGATSDAVHKALDAHEKTVLADIKTKATEAKKLADVAELEKAAGATQDAALRKTLQDQADKLRGGKLPTGEATELATTPTPKPEKVGKIPVGEVIEGQPEIMATPPRKIPAGEATEITPEVIAPEEPIPVGEATEITPVSNRPSSEVVSNRPKAEPVSNRPSVETGRPIVNREPVSDYSHGALYKAAEVAGIETRGRRPSEVRAAFERSWAKEHGLNPMDAERARNVAKALDIDEKAVENAAVQHERSPRMFDREIDRIIEQGTPEPMKYTEASREAKRLTETTGTPHEAVQRDTTDSEGFTVGGWYAEPVTAKAAKTGMSLEEAKAHVAQANIDRPLGRTWGDLERMQGGKLKGAPNATETHQAADRGQSPAVEPAAQRPAGAVEAGSERPGPDGAATPRASGEGDQRSGPGQTHGVDKQGNPYTVSVKAEDFGAGPDKSKSVLVEARDPETGARRGFVDFAVRDDGVLVAENAKVAPEFKKRGIAEMMYKAARDAGHDIAPGRVQTDEGHAMVESLQRKGLINKEAEGPRFRAGDLDLAPIEGETIPGEKATRPETEAIPETKLETRVPGKKQWNITLKSKTSGRTREVTMPGGLSEPEAARGAVLKAGNDWMVSRQDLGTAESRGPAASAKWVEEGATPEQNLAFKVDYEAKDFARTLLEEVTSGDFGAEDYKALSQVIADRAKEAKVPADDMRAAVLKQLDTLGMKKATQEKVRRALAPKGFEKGAAKPGVFKGTEILTATEAANLAGSKIPFGGRAGDMRAMKKQEAQIVAYLTDKGVSKARAAQILDDAQAAQASANRGGLMMFLQNNYLRDVLARRGLVKATEAAPTVAETAKPAAPEPQGFEKGAAKPARTDQIGDQHKAEGNNGALQEFAKNVDQRSVETYVQGMTPMQRARAVETLNDVQNFNGVPKIRSTAMRERVAAGATIVDAKEGRRLTLPNGSFLAEKDITKAAMDYAASLIKQRDEAPAVHKDPGQPAEPVTPKVVTAAVSKNAKPAQAREALLKSIDEALAKAPERDASIGTTAPRTRMGKAEFTGRRGSLDEFETYVSVEVREGRDGNWSMTASDGSGKGGREKVMDFQASGPAEARSAVESMLARARKDGGKVVFDKPDMVTFKVPGDGEFKVTNDPVRLAKFRAAVEKSPGFATSRTKTAPENTGGAHRGSGTPASAIENMVDEGDFQAAYDYAVAKGIDPETVKLGPKPLARFKAWLKDNPPLD